MEKTVKVGLLLLVCITGFKVFAVSAQYTPLFIDLRGYERVSSDIDSKTEKYLYSQNSSQSYIAFGSGEVSKNKSDLYIKNLYLQGLNKFFTPSKWLKQGENKIVNGVVWYDFQYISNALSDNKCCDLFNYHLMTIYKKRLVTFSYTCPVERMNSNRVSTQALVKSLKFSK